MHLPIIASLSFLTVCISLSDTLLFLSLMYIILITEL